MVLPFAIGLLVIISVLVASVMNEWALIDIDDGHEKYLKSSIAIDSEDNQHILMGYWDDGGLVHGISYVRVEDRDATELVLDDSRGLADGSILVDSVGNPHFLYVTYELFHMGPQPRTLEYGVIEDGSLKALTVDYGFVLDEFDLAVDSHDVPHMVYSDSTDVIYAHLEEGTWKKQNVSSFILFSWPLKENTYEFDLAIAVDSQDVPHITAIVGWNVICCDLLPNSSWRVTRWSSGDSVGREFDAASDSKGNTYVVFEASVPDSGMNYIYLGTLTSDAFWSFQPYINLTNLADIQDIRELELAVDENDGLALCFGYGSPATLFYQIEHNDGVENGSLDNSAEQFLPFDMAVGTNGHVCLVGGSTSSLEMLTNSASLGEKLRDLHYGWFLLFVGGASIAVGTVYAYLRYREQRGRG